MLALLGEYLRRVNNGEYQIELLRYSGVMADNSAQNMIYGFAAVFIAIIMIASVSLIYNVFAISVSERVRQLGMLASVGATLGELCCHCVDICHCGHDGVLFKI